MIRSRLNVLLAERDLRQDQISADTGISKVTISNIVNNKTNGFQYETLNELSKYLQITPGDLFEYYDQDIFIDLRDSELTITDYSFLSQIKSEQDFEESSQEENALDISIEGISYKISKSGNIHFDLPLYLNVQDIDSRLSDGLEVVGTNIDGVISISDQENNRKNAFNDFIKNLPMSFKQTVSDMFIEFLHDHILTLKSVPSGRYSVSLDNQIWFNIEKK